MARTTNDPHGAIEDPAIEAVVSKELGQAVSEEVFMNQDVWIEVASSPDENSPPRIALNMNERATVIERGVPTKVKRYFVEILARCKETKYSQRKTDMDNPEMTNYPVGRTAWAYPFQVLEDPSPKGRAWLEAVRAEPA